MDEAVKISETIVKVIQGNLTAQRTDAIVTTNNATLDQNFGVNKSIQSAAGDKVKEECARLAKLPNDGCAVTSGGNLKCKYLIHLINAKPEVISQSVQKALRTCDQRNVTSISFPALGTGAAKLDAHSSVKLMFKGFDEYLSSLTTKSNINEIVIVVFEQSIFDIYSTFLKNYKRNYYHFSAYGTNIELIQADITQQKVDCVVNLTNATLDRASGVSKPILNAAGNGVKEECKKIGVLQQDKVAITSGGELKAKKIMHVIGPLTESGFEPSIEKIILQCDELNFASVALPAIGTGTAGVDPEVSIKAILNGILSCLSKTSIPNLQTISIIVFEENIFTTYLQVFQAKSADLLTLKQEETKLLEHHAQVTINFPSTWTDTGKNEFQEVTLTEGSSEYFTVKNKFTTTASPDVFEVLEIKRIQNEKLWKSFTINKQAVEKKNPGNTNVRRLYHGTSSDVINNINKGGFNRIYNNKNGIACGTGTYFSNGSNYSTRDPYSVPDIDGKKHVYQVSVLTGRYCRGNQSYKEPPHIKNDPNGDRYDSVVNGHDKKYFVVFYDNYAYPEYLITFKRLTQQAFLNHN
ncbi:protein mono-ADP-ribosyltransferase PARP15-like [Phyllobates terribilis]|uniref:protein mono-ADP-ribosyltransferase PARP15-like n=1 Tax=Phyllobates terribilis TaxID=111132 RepID=UPI003CCAE497